MSNRIELHTFWGEKSLKRKAKVYHVNEGYFEVDFYKKDKVIETRKMITEGVVHSKSYAEDAAENWCMGII
jgi:hypothetical protein